MLRKYSTARVYANRKTRIKRAKNRMKLRIKEIVRVKKSHVRARLVDISLVRMYEVVLTDMSVFFFSGVYAAAHDFKTEWVVVKGIKDFADETQSSSEKWNQIACVMAASVVANILKDPVIFQDWLHFNAGIF